MIIWLFMVLMIMLLLALLNVKWDSEKNVDLDVLWMLEDDAEESEEVD
jgi:hypothetical protein